MIACYRPINVHLMMAILITPLIRWVHPTLPLSFSCHNLVANYLNPLETQLFCFSACRSQSSVSKGKGKGKGKGRYSS